MHERCTEQSCEESARDIYTVCEEQKSLTAPVTMHLSAWKNNESELPAYLFAISVYNSRGGNERSTEESCEYEGGGNRMRPQRCTLSHFMKEYMNDYIHE